MTINNSIIIILSILIAILVIYYLYNLNSYYPNRLSFKSDNFFKKISKVKKDSFHGTSIYNHKTNFLKQNSSILFSFFKKKKDVEKDELNIKNNRSFKESFYNKDVLI